ncbi:MAG: hypothetical protein Q4C30_10155 [Bacteroidia bacterium]|nr:hypothetical protein [Bacteroidia bacterium]
MSPPHVTQPGQGWGTDVDLPKEETVAQASSTPFSSTPFGTDFSSIM